MLGLRIESRGVDPEILAANPGKIPSRDETGCSQSDANLQKKINSSFIIMFNYLYTSNTSMMWPSQNFLL